jgi:hypothetical protein
MELVTTPIAQKAPPPAGKHAAFVRDAVALAIIKTMVARSAKAKASSTNEKSLKST